jgi:heat shock protein 4
VALGLDYGGFKKSEMGEGKNVVFVDFGHAQLTTSLIRFTETQMDVIVQMSNRDLGCRNIDFKVFDHIAKKFE